MTYLVTTFDAFTCRMPMVLELADRKLALNYLANQILNLSSRGRITTLKKNESNKACFFADGRDATRHDVFCCEVVRVLVFSEDAAY